MVGGWEGGEADRYFLFLLDIFFLTFWEGLPDYHDIIKEPMDLGTIVAKLDDDEYTDIGASLVRDSLSILFFFLLCESFFFP